METPCPRARLSLDHKLSIYEIGYSDGEQPDRGSTRDSITELPKWYFPHLDENDHRHDDADKTTVKRQAALPDLEKIKIIPGIKSTVADPSAQNRGENGPHEKIIDMLFFYSNWRALEIFNNPPPGTYTSRYPERPYQRIAIGKLPTIPMLMSTGSMLEMAKQKSCSSIS